MHFRTTSPLSDDEELIVHEVVGSALAVHRELGPGYLESFYKNAMCRDAEPRYRVRV